MSRARAEQSPESQKAILELSKKSLQLYTEFFKEESVEVDLIEGIATLYNDAIEARQTAQLLNARFIDDGEVSELGFNGFGGGVIHERELSINPTKLLKSLHRKLVGTGVNIIDATTTNLQGSPPKVTSVVASERTLKADAYVVAGGSWSSEICRPLGFNPQVLPARGMAMVFDTGGVEITQIPALFEDYGTVVVQHNRSTVRITGFFDLVGFSGTYNESRKRWLLHVARKHVKKYGEMRFVEEGIGYRPCTPDRLPSIGPVLGYNNLYIASGHCRIGITLAPVTGYALKCMIDGEECPIDLSQFSPSRFT